MREDEYVVLKKAIESSAQSANDATRLAIAEYHEFGVVSEALADSCIAHMVKVCEHSNALDEAMSAEMDQLSADAYENPDALEAFAKQIDVIARMQTEVRGIHEDCRTVLLALFRHASNRGVSMADIITEYAAKAA